jgi:hypothetical protein
MRIRQARKIISPIRVVDGKRWTIHRKDSVSVAFRTYWRRSRKRNKRLAKGFEVG